MICLTRKPPGFLWFQPSKRRSALFYCWSSWICFKSARNTFTEIITNAFSIQFAGKMAGYVSKQNGRRRQQYNDFSRGLSASNQTKTMQMFLFESQRDSIHQPRVARHALPWVNAPNISSILKAVALPSARGLAHSKTLRVVGSHSISRQRLGLRRPSAAFTESSINREPREPREQPFPKSIRVVGVFRGQSNFHCAFDWQEHKIPSVT